jgi:hypothetical protein
MARKEAVPDRMPASKTEAFLAAARPPRLKEMT